MSDRRGPWYLLTGVILGLALGLLVGWVLVPVQYVDSTPASLRSDFKDEYRYMIAAAYSATGNLERARARLGLLEDIDSVKALGDQAQRMLSHNKSQEVTRALVDLSLALQGSSISTAKPPSPQPVSTSKKPTSSPGPVTDSPPAEKTPISSAIPTLEEQSTLLPTPIYTAMPRPTRKPSPTAGAPFAVTSQSAFCEPTQPGLLQLSLQDSDGKPVAGIELVLTWSGGEEHLFTGLKPELGTGYADFVMSPNAEYALSLSNGSVRITGLIPSACAAEDGSSYPGGIRLEFKQP